MHIPDYVWEYRLPDFRANHIILVRMTPGHRYFEIIQLRCNWIGRRLHPEIIHLLHNGTMIIDACTPIVDVLGISDLNKGTGATNTRVFGSVDNFLKMPPRRCLLLDHPNLTFEVIKHFWVVVSNILYFHTNLRR